MYSGSCFACLDYKRHEWWIGLNDLKTEGNFEWINGAKLGFTNWEPNQPDSISGDGAPGADCALMRHFNMSSFKWYDRNCNFQLRLS